MLSGLSSHFRWLVLGSQGCSVAGEVAARSFSVIGKSSHTWLFAGTGYVSIRK